MLQYFYMNKLKKIILSSSLILSCNENPLCIDAAGEEKGDVVSCCCRQRITEDDVFRDLQNFTSTAGIELPTEHEPIKIQNLTGDLFKPGSTFNACKITDYASFVDRGEEENFMYLYHVSGERKHFLIFQNLFIFSALKKMGFCSQILFILNLLEKILLA